MAKRISGHHRGTHGDAKAPSTDFLRSVLKHEYRKQPPVKEAEWSRMYKCGETTIFESKFLMDGLEVSADSIRKRWPNLGPAEKRDFSLAFMCKPTLTEEDLRILDFLMEAGDPPVWRHIALQLARHPSRVRVIAFLAERIEEKGLSKANFYQAFEVMSDRRGLPALMLAFDRYSEALARGKLVAVEEYRDYLACSRAIWKISGSTRHRDAIAALLKSENAEASSLAEHYLRDASG